MTLSETQMAYPESRLALKASPCGIDGCRGPVAAEIDGRPMCLEHFISVSALEAGARSACLDTTPVDTTAASALKKFLGSCLEQAQRIADHKELPPLVRTQLTDIVSRFSKLGQRLRRSPRVAVAVPVWLRREDERNTWEEETWTSILSQHGAGFVCRHAVEINGFVVLCRRDKGSRARARVVYSRFDSDGRRQIGVELVDRDDFWDTPHPSTPSDLN